MGAERSVANIPRKDKNYRGSADTLYNRVIIEYENDLKTSLKHAKEQLAGYFLGQFNSGEGYNYTLIITDLLTWKVFAPDVSCLERLGSLTEDELILNEITSVSFTLSESKTEDFYFWLDRFLFKEEKQKATLKRIEESFGYQSSVFIECFRELSVWFKEAKKYGEVQVSYEQWKKFLSIAYGKFDATENTFLIHTYLSVFAKMLAYSVISNDDYIDETELRGILDGEIFKKLHISNFVDNDFFHWVKSDLNFRNLKKSFRLLAQEISTFDFMEVDEDVLKGVYQELIDIDTRHALGEYYTPDWLCERVTMSLSLKKSSTILDPSCGSGSFLRAAVHQLRKQHPDITVEELCNQVYGFDIHPLSVQIAKTTMLLALGADVKTLKRPIHLNVMLSNTLKIPDGVQTLFGSDFRMDIDKESFRLSSQVLNDMGLFDKAIDICDDLAEQTLNQKDVPVSTLENSIKNNYKHGGLNPQILESFYKIYKALKKVKEQGRDSIWKFILQNLYKPYFLRNKFDFIIGNPPWFTYSSIKNEEYQDTLNELAEAYHVKPEKVSNFPHLEIAAIFVAHCTNYFLRGQGLLAFVLPRSFFNADHHDNTRRGAVKGVSIAEIWDLKNVSPLFNILSCVLFFRKREVQKKIDAAGVAGLSFSANLPAHNCNYSAASGKLSEEKNTWFYIKQGKSSALSTSKSNGTGPGKKTNFYKKFFRQGATIVPRGFYFIDLVVNVPDFDDRTIHVKTAEAIKPDAKSPWKETVDFNAMMESRFVFCTALSKSILPFALYKPDLVILPITVELDNYSKKKIVLHNPTDLQRKGHLYASRWFNNAEYIWKIHRTEKNKNISSENYLNWQNKLTDQNLNLPYLVLYNASAKDANATVVNRSELNLEFIVESKGYAFATENINEAYYVAAFLNSSSPNERMKDFQTSGLFGARDVHKKILDIYYPKFNEKNKTHTKIATLSALAHAKAKQFLEEHPPKQELTAIFLGRLRMDLKKHLGEEIRQMDELVDTLIA